MNNKNDIRWLQRLANFQKAMRNLAKAVNLSATRELSDLEKQGLIQGFEIVYELAWKTIKDFYEEQGESNIQGSRDAFRLAFNRGLIEDGDVFMQAIKSRQQTSHAYDETIFNLIYFEIIEKYYEAFKILAIKLGEMSEK